MQDDYRRIRSAKAINYLQVFSLEQLAKIARVTVKDLQEAGVVDYYEKSGLLNPMSIKTMRIFFVTYRTKGYISQPLLHIMLREGTEVETISQITGIPIEELEIT